MKLGSKMTKPGKNDVRRRTKKKRRSTRQTGIATNKTDGVWFFLVFELFKKYAIKKSTPITFEHDFSGNN